MHGDAALDEQIRMRIFPNSKLKGEREPPRSCRRSMPRTSRSTC
jgi:hypothetical protein